MNVKLHALSFWTTAQKQKNKKLINCLNNSISKYWNNQKKIVWYARIHIMPIIKYWMCLWYMLYEIWVKIHGYVVGIYLLVFQYNMRCWCVREEYKSHSSSNEKLHIQSTIRIPTCKMSFVRPLFLYIIFCFI